MKKAIFYFISILIIACKTAETTENKADETSVETVMIPAKIEDTNKVYEVKKGDTLWGISKKLYNDPYLWPKIWEKNKSKIKNPNKIYPNYKIEYIEKK